MYWSGWVDLWYTVNDKELSASGVTKGVKEGNATVSLSTFYCKLNCWINTIDMLQKFLFMGPLLDEPSVIHIPKPTPGGVGGRLGGLSSQNVPCTDWEI